MRRLRAEVAISILIVSAGAWAAPRNLLTDPGFERARRTGLVYWSKPGGWSGSLTVVSDRTQVRTGRRCARLDAAKARGRWWGRCLGSRPLRITPGARYELAVWAKGRGELVLGCIEYGRRGKNKTYNYVGKDHAAPLADTWKRVVLHYQRQEPSTYRTAFYIEVRGEGSYALLDDAQAALSPVPGYALKIRPSHTMAPLGGATAFEVTVTAPTAAGPGKLLVRRTSPGGATTEDSVVPDAHGRVRYVFTTTAKTEPGPHSLTFVHKDAGIAEHHHVDVVAPAMYAEFAARAKAVRLPDGEHLVFVGDSLTAHMRGYNYVDKVRGWLHQKHGDRVRVTNAGVGGDFITRVAKRLDADVIAIKPTHAFIFLGHNDSKAGSSSGYKKHCVAPATFAKMYAEVIRQIISKAGARVTVMSSTSSVYEITRATAEAKSKAGRAHNFFGRPQDLEMFNQLARGAADACGAAYLDVYGPTRSHANKPTLFTPDGVHLSNEGNRFIALQLLRYLSSR